jgi:hypothetical protein
LLTAAAKGGVATKAIPAEAIGASRSYSRVIRVAIIQKVSFRLGGPLAG